MAWIASCRPDVMGTSNLYSQITPEKFEEKHVKSLNKLIRYVHDTANDLLTYIHLNIELEKLVVFSDGSHATSNDGT